MTHDVTAPTPFGRPPFALGQMIGMEQWVNKQMTDLVEDLVAKLKEDGLVPNIYTYNGVLFV